MVEILKSDKDEFQVVQEIPPGYQVWNIGRHNFPFKNYIPLCVTYPDYSINPNTLKAFNVGDEKLALLIMQLAHRFPMDKENILKLIKQHKESNNDR